MAEEADPATLFFGEEDVDLYEVLGLSRDEKPSEDDIRRAYRKKALQSHPDKAQLRGEADAEAAALAFQQVGFAYSVLSDAKRRRRYDTTGSTSDSIFADEEVDWNEYFKTLWDGEVSHATLDEFKEKYQGSEEEEEDILDAYRDGEGSLEHIFANVPCSNILDDEARFIDIVNGAIATKKLPKTKAWSSLTTADGKRARKALKAKARHEASEAEEYAKELGVHDQFFGKKKAKEAPKAQDDDEEVDLDALRAAMQAKSAQRATDFDAMLGRLEREPRTQGPNRKRAKVARR